MVVAASLLIMVSVLHGGRGTLKVAAANSMVIIAASIMAEGRKEIQSQEEATQSIHTREISSSQPLVLCFQPLTVQTSFLRYRPLTLNDGEESDVTFG